MVKIRNNTINKSLSQTIITIGNTKLKGNNIFCVCIALYYAFAVLNRVMIALNNGSIALGATIRFGTYGLIIFILLGLVGSIRRFAVLIFWEIVAGALFLFSAATGSVGDADWQNVYQLIATTYIPLSLAAYYNADRKMLMKVIHLVAVASAPVLIAVAIMTYGNWESSYDMSLGYVMAFSALVLLAQFTIDSRIYNMVLAVLLSIFILFVGSRGPFICIIAFLLIELIFSERFNGKKRVAIIITVCALAGVIWLNFDNILSFVYNLSVNLGFDSRSIRLLVEGEAITHDSGREALYEHYICLFKKHSFFGYGVMGAWISDVMYPHNIVLEFFLAFGYIVGVPLLILLLVILIKGVSAKNERYNNTLIIVFISYCMHLLVSGTYLKVWQFFVCIALCLPNKRMIQYNNHE